VPGVKLGHVDGRRSFESILLKYGLTTDPAVNGEHAGTILYAKDESPLIEA
jgi:hypothetical protein